MLNITIEEFKEKWFVAEYGDSVYTNGTLKGTICYEDNHYFVIKLEH